MYSVPAVVTTGDMLSAKDQPNTLGANLMFVLGRVPQGTARIMEIQANRASEGTECFLTGLRVKCLKKTVEKPDMVEITYVLYCTSGYLMPRDTCWPPRMDAERDDDGLGAM